MLTRLALLLAAPILALAALACGAEDDSGLGAVPPPPDVTVVTVLERATPTVTPTPTGTAPATTRGVSASGCDPVTNPQTVTTSTGLQYIDECVGRGPTPRTGDTVVVHYTGTLTNGTEFDSSRSRNQPFTFRLGQGEVIRGWDEAFATMTLGTKRKLIIPPDLAYGSRGQGPIPPNSTLNFDVELLEIR